MRNFPNIAFLLANFVFVSCTCSEQKSPTGTSAEGTSSSTSVQGSGVFVLDREQALADLTEFTKEPHPFGSPRQRVVGRYIQGRAESLGLRVIYDTFNSPVPNPEVSKDVGSSKQRLSFMMDGVNIVALGGFVKEPQCLVLLGSHYDTKHIAGIDYVGANDSASSSLLLLQLMKNLKEATAGKKLLCDIAAVWFDGEESVLPDWDDGVKNHPSGITDNTHGSRSMAGNLTTCEKMGKSMQCAGAALGGHPVTALILMDMIGSKDLKITRDTNSTPSLSKLLDQVMDDLDLDGLRGGEKAVADDHISFIKEGVPAINIIDFENLDTWHAATDISANISMESIENTGKIAMRLALELAANPQAAAP